MFRLSLYVAIIVSFIVTFYNIRSTQKLISKKGRLDDAQKRLNQLINQNKLLKKELEYKKSDTFVIKEAREKLNYSFENEKIIVFPNEDFINASYEYKKSDKKELPKNKDTSTSYFFGNDNVPNYILWFRAFFY